MASKAFDHLTRTIARSDSRRGALKTLVAGGAAAVAAHVGSAWSEAKKKKRCRKRLAKCGGSKKCCNGSGRIKCQNVQEETKPQCDGKSGRRCCGLDGASCNRDELHCDCCGSRTFCIEVGPGEFRCQDDLT
jgi:hypothetical protein